MTVTLMECSFSIVFGTDKTFDLIAADSIEREFWLNKLRYIMFEAKTAKKTKDRRAFVEKCFKEADKDGDRFINFFEAMSILNRLNIAINNELAKEFGRSFLISGGTTIGAEELQKIFKEEHIDMIDLANFYTKEYIVLDSSNYDSTIHWNVGCQMVALNPDFLMTTKEGQSPKPLRLELTVLSGQHLRNTDSSPEDDIIDPYVKISVIDRSVKIDKK
uniref:phosphoinositide phospholipase C n=1 Tax=Tetranychus urticae TaxID=32264 RepID=T1KSZ0_TETUR